MKGIKSSCNPKGRARTGISSSRSATLLALLMLTCIVFGGCSKKVSPPTSSSAAEGEDQLTITASFYPLYVMLLNITENVPGLSLNLMAPADTGCLHHYHLSPADMKLLQDTDIMVVNGAHMEEFMDKVLETLDQNAIVTATGDWPLVDDNPHVWVSPAGAIHQVQQIADGLARRDPANSQRYQQNAAAYTAKLQTLLDKMHHQLDPLAGASMITFHEAFPYFAAEFNLDLAGSIQREPDSEPTAKELVETIALIREVQERQGQVALFAEVDFASSAAEVIAAETGLSVHQLDPAVTGIIHKDAYLQAMERNATILQQALEN
ncbi:MAG: zinc ABC transporter substrate-binding protein [Spirochaetaceae bacterium]|nr:zinc ABC transporter substrate-binding protein [Spirochaetaceae bacterium]